MVEKKVERPLRHLDEEARFLGAVSSVVRSAYRRWMRSERCESLSSDVDSKC